MIEYLRWDGLLYWHTFDQHERIPMKTEYTVVVKQADDWWVGWVEEVPGVNCQEKSYDELMESLKLTLQEALEFN
mgnify:FL=1